MGNRLTKVIGYGFTDLQDNDPAINWDAIHNYEENEAKTWDQFIEFCKQSITADNHIDRIELTLLSTHIKELTRTGINHRLDRCFVYDEESRKDTIVFIEPGSPDWYRRDDIIDYVWNNVYRVYEPVVHKLRTGIYPYIGSYRNRKTGEKMPDGMTEVFLRVYNSDNQEGVKANEGALNTMAQKYGFDGFYDLIENIMPIPPSTIVKYIEFMGFVKDKAILNQLRPLAYELVR